MPVLENSNDYCTGIGFVSVLADMFSVITEAECPSWRQKLERVKCGIVFSAEDWVCNRIQFFFLNIRDFQSNIGLPYYSLNLDYSKFDGMEISEQLFSMESIIFYW